MRNANRWQLRASTQLVGFDNEDRRIIESLTSYTNVNFSTWWENLSLPARLAGNDIFCWRTFTENKKLATPPLESAIVVQFLFRSHAYLLRNVVRLCAAVAYVLSYAFAIPLLLFLLILLPLHGAISAVRYTFRETGKRWCACVVENRKFLQPFPDATSRLMQFSQKCARLNTNRLSVDSHRKPGWKSWIRNANLAEWFALATKKGTWSKKPGNFQRSIERNWKISKSKFRRN